MPALTHSLPRWTQANPAVTWTSPPGAPQGSVFCKPQQHGSSMALQSLQAPCKPLRGRAGLARGYGCGCTSANKPGRAQAGPDAFLKLKCLRPQWSKYKAESSLWLSRFTTLQLFCSSSSTAGRQREETGESSPGLAWGRPCTEGRQSLCYETAPLSRNS